MQKQAVMKRKRESGGTRKGAKAVKPLDRSDLDELFQEKCYQFDLPRKWNEDVSEVEAKAMELPPGSFLTREYNKVKDELMGRAVCLADILNIRGVSAQTKTDLVERLSVMQAHDGSIVEFMFFRDKLREDIVRLRALADDKGSAIERRRAALCQSSRPDDELESRILALELNDAQAAVVYQRYLRLSKIPPNDGEHHKLREWLQVVLGLPLATSHHLGMGQDLQAGAYLERVRAALDAELYGMDQIKEELLTVVNHKLRHPEATNVSIALVGPPGVGKTHIVQCLARVLGLPMEHISMGGASDASFLAGHSYTYEGARPGQIVGALTRMGCANGVLFFDELDKIGTTRHGEEVSNQLVHITDFTQNHAFCDRYLAEIPIDLSKSWFVFSLNDEAQVNPVLRNRLKLVRVPGYSARDKLHILTKHMVPSQMACCGLSAADYTLSEQVAQHIVSVCKDEPGVRELKRATETIFRRLELVDSLDSRQTSRLSFGIGPISKPHALTCAEVDKLLAQRREDPIPPSLRMMYM